MTRVEKIFIRLFEKPGGRLYLHLGFWMTVILSDLLSHWAIYFMVSLPRFLGYILLHQVLLVVIVYVNLYVLLPNYLLRKKYWQYSIAASLLVVLFACLQEFWDMQFWSTIEMGNHTPRQTIYFIITNVLHFGLFLLITVACKLSRQWFYQRAHIRNIELEKANTELKYLKSQINPHFLFNSLNTIFFQIDKENDLARDALLKFSDMLRYQLYDCNADKIPIEKEVEYLENYLGLQKLRVDQTYDIDFHTDTLKGFTIAPLLLMPFVENAFKHISHYPYKMNELNIALSRRNGEFKFHIENTKEDHELLRATRKKGIGLENVRRRLELLYPGKHHLQVRSDEEKFYVELFLTIDE